MSRDSWLSFLPALLLAFAMFMAGQAKLTPLLTPDVSAEIASHAPDWSRVLPTHPSPALLLQAIGASEVVGAALLLLPWTRRVGALAVLAVMLGAVAVHVRLGEPFTVPAGLAGLGALVWLLSARPARRSAAKKRS